MLNIRDKFDQSALSHRDVVLLLHLFQPVNSLRGDYKFEQSSLDHRYTIHQLLLIQEEMLYQTSFEEPWTRWSYSASHLSDLMPFPKRQTSPSSFLHPKFLPVSLSFPAALSLLPPEFPHAWNHILLQLRMFYETICLP